MKIIGITGSPNKENQVNFARYKTIFIEQIIEQGYNNFLPVFINPNSDNIDFYINHCNGFIFTGGDEIIQNKNFNNYDQHLFHEDIYGRAEFEIKLMQSAIKKHKPIIAICYGMQILNTSLGGDLKQSQLLHYSQNKTKRFNNFHSIKFLKDHIFNFDAINKVNSEHSQEINKLSPKLEAIAIEPETGAIEMVKLMDSKFCYGFQWHPEQIKPQFNEILSKFLKFC